MTSVATKTIDVPCPICDRHSGSSVASGYDFEYRTCAEEFTFRRCASCDVTYLNPRPDTSELAKIYPPEYNPFHFHKIRNPIVRWGRRLTQKRKLSAIRKLLAEDATVLDVGCGSGDLLKLMAEFGSKRWRLFGNDLNQESLKTVAQLGIGTIPGRFEEVNVGMQFDLIVLNQTIEHLEEPAKVIRKAADVLRPSGVLFIETPCIMGADAKLFRRRYWGGYHIPRHWSLFSPSSISALLRANGFDTITIGYLASPSFWIQSFHHFFLDHNYPRWWTKSWVSRNPLLLTAFTLWDLVTIACGCPTSNMRVVAHRE
jgi:SAM-dependent methyltransferase